MSFIKAVRSWSLSVAVTTLVATAAAAQASPASLAPTLGAPVEYAQVLRGGIVSPFRRDSIGSAYTDAAARITLSTMADSASRPHKSSGLAWFLSFLVPGGGQAYNGQWGKAALFFSASVAGFAMMYSGDGPMCEDCTTFDAGALIATASWVGSQIDAPISAGKINRRAAGQYSVGPQTRITLVAIQF
jgi:hypothetical protein